jgi:hypothetical protein
MAYYCWRVTGNPLLMPQALNRQIYAVAPYFLWQSPRPIPVYHHEIVRSLYLRRELPRYLSTRTPLGLAFELGIRATGFWMFFLGPLLTLPIVMAIVTLPYGFSLRRLSESTRFLLSASVVAAGGLGVEVFFAPHYAGPMTCLVYAWVVMAMRHLRGWQWRGKAGDGLDVGEPPLGAANSGQLPDEAGGGITKNAGQMPGDASVGIAESAGLKPGSTSALRPSGLFLVGAIPVIGILMVFLRVEAGPLHVPLPTDKSFTWCTPPKPEYGRAAMGRFLNTYPGRHLVLVRYKPGHDEGFDWIYNDADIDGSKVVWARDLGTAKNQELIDYFRGRHVWWVEADDSPPKLIPYNASLPTSERGF